MNQMDLTVYYIVVLKKIEELKYGLEVIHMLDQYVLVI